MLVCIFIILAIIFCLIMIIIGALHADRSFSEALQSEEQRLQLNTKIKNYLSSLRSGCPGQPIIPWYLIIAGTITIIFLVGRILICRLCSHHDVVKCDLSYLLIYDVIMFLISIIWLSVGTHYTDDLFHRKNYATHNPNQDTCDFGLFWYSFAIIVLGWITVLLSLIWIINKYGRSVFHCMTCNKYLY